MERDSILSHGVSSFLKESTMERSDKYKMTVNETSGLISSSDGSEEHDTGVEVPYACKLLLQELQTMSIGPRLVTQ